MAKKPEKKKPVAIHKKSAATRKPDVKSVPKKPASKGKMDGLVKSVAKAVAKTITGRTPAAKKAAPPAKKVTAPTKPVGKKIVVPPKAAAPAKGAVSKPTLTKPTMAKPPSKVAPAKPAGKAQSAKSHPAKPATKPATKPVAKPIVAKKPKSETDQPAVVDTDVSELTDGEAAPEEVVLTDAEGRRYCRVRDCDQLASVDGYCRYHYLLYWKKIQIRKKILSEGKLERYVEELTARYPDKFLEMLRKDLRSEKEFLSAIQELEIDESAMENELEDETQTYIDEVRGMAEPGAREEEDF
jgi:hypothetical protein